MDSEREKELSAKLMGWRNAGLADPSFRPPGTPADAVFNVTDGYWFTDAEGTVLKTDGCYFRRYHNAKSLKAISWRVTYFGAVSVDDYTEVTDGAQEATA